MSKSKFLQLAFASGMSLIVSAHAEVLTFNDTAGVALPGNDGAYAGLYTVFLFDHPSVFQNYSFVSQGGHWYAGYWNAVVFCGGTSVNCAYNGTDHLLAGPVLSVSRADGKSFSLNGLDLNNGRDINVTEAAASFTVNGFKTDGTTISTTVTLDNLPNSQTFGSSAAFNHFDFVGFTDLRAFEINRITANEWGYLTLDNLNVTAATPVPEPSSWLMLGLGLLGLGAHAKRRKG